MTKVIRYLLFFAVFFAAAIVTYSFETGAEVVRRPSGNRI